MGANIQLKKCAKDCLQTGAAFGLQRVARFLRSRMKLNPWMLGMRRKDGRARKAQKDKVRKERMTEERKEGRAMESKENTGSFKDTAATVGSMVTRRQTAGNAKGHLAEEEKARRNDEEVQEMNVVPGPPKPTAADVARRNLTHIPAAVWCEQCRKGNGKDKDHRRVEGFDRAVKADGTETIEDAAEVVLTAVDPRQAEWRQQCHCHPRIGRLVMWSER